MMNDTYYCMARHQSCHVSVQIELVSVATNNNDGKVCNANNNSVNQLMRMPVLIQ